MSLGIVLAAALSAAAPPDSAAAPAPASEGVTSYTADAFASSQPSTALDMVNHLPGFTFDSGDSVRGFGGAAGNVLIDGARPASKEDPLEEILKRIPVSQVVRIDVIRGGAPGVDMQGKTVIANVIRKTDGGLKVTAAVASNFVYDGRVRPSARLEASRRFGETSVEGGLLAGWGVDDGAGEGPLIRRGPDGTLREQAFQDSTANGDRFSATGAVETPLLGGKIRLNAFGLYNPYDYRADDSYSFPSARLESDHLRDIVWKSELGLRFNRAFGAADALEVFAVQQLNREDVTDAFRSPAFDADFALKSTTGESVVRGVWKHTFSPGLSMEAGAEGAFNWLNGKTSFAQDGVPIALPAANVRVEERRGELFTTWTWRLAPTVTLESGMRYEFSRISASGDVVLANSFKFAKPRATLTWSPGASDQFRGRIEREVGQLKFTDFVASSSQIGTGVVRAGNPDLSPQQAWVFEAAYEHRFWKGAQISVTGRHYKLTDVIDRAAIIDEDCLQADPTDPNCVFDAPGNIGEGTRDELALSLTLPTDRLGLKRGQLQVQSTWRRSKVTDPTTLRSREISGLRPVEWEAHYTQAVPSLKSTWGIDVFGAWRERYFRFNEVDTDVLRTWVSVFAEYKPRPDLSVRVEIDNATARPFHHERDVYPTLRSVSIPTYIETRNSRFGRMLYVRIRKTFG